MHLGGKRNAVQIKGEFDFWEFAFCQKQRIGWTQINSLVSVEYNFSYFRNKEILCQEGFLSLIDTEKVSDIWFWKLFCNLDLDHIKTWEPCI